MPRGPQIRQTGAMTAMDPPLYGDQSLHRPGRPEPTAVPGRAPPLRLLPLNSALGGRKGGNAGPEWGPRGRAGWHTLILQAQKQVGGLGLEHRALEPAWWELGPWAGWLEAPTPGNPLVHTPPCHIAGSLLAPGSSRCLQEAPLVPRPHCLVPSGSCGLTLPPGSTPGSPPPPLLGTHGLLWAHAAQH